MLGYSSPQSNDVISLENWIESTASLAREETAYLQRRDDLLSIAPSKDDTLAWFELIVERILVAFYRSIGNVSVPVLP